MDPEEPAMAPTTTARATATPKPGKPPVIELGPKQGQTKEAKARHEGEDKYVVDESIDEDVVFEDRAGYFLGFCRRIVETPSNPDLVRPAALVPFAFDEEAARAEIGSRRRQREYCRRGKATTRDAPPGHERNGPPRPTLTEWLFGFLLLPF